MPAWIAWRLVPDVPLSAKICQGWKLVFKIAKYAYKLAKTALRPAKLILPT
jgi:hypothetical protein